MLRGSLVTQLIHVAARLGIADLLGDEPRTADELAKAVGAHPHALYRVLRALASLGIFAERKDGRFVLTPLAEPLRSDAPASLRGSAILYGEPWWWGPCGQLLRSVLTNQAGFDHFHGADLFKYLEEHPDAAHLFNDHQTNMTRQDAATVITAYDFSGLETIVDVGGGYGTLLAGVLKAHPPARGILFEQESVIEAARTRIQAEGVEDRCQLVVGDFFQSVPGGGDAYILKDVIHDWEDDRAVKILRNCRRAITTRRDTAARILLIEKVIPPGNAAFTGKLTDITMLLMTGGHERTREEYRRLLETAGLQMTRAVETRGPSTVLEALLIP